jgi:hypothetical protein
VTLSRRILAVLVELAGKSLRELELMRATIHARGGLVFLPAWLHEHFVRQSFYEAGVYDEGKLSDVDRKNLVMLERHVVGIPRAELEKRWGVRLSAFDPLPLR